MRHAGSNHVSRTRPSPFPPAAPHDPSAPHVAAARIMVDAAEAQGELTRIWESIGYDEFNWTYTPTGKGLLRTFGELPGGAYHVRPHYVFCSGSGFGIPHWSAGNVYHEDADGEPYFDFTLVDQAYDAIVDAGHHVLVELAFTPRDLVPDHAQDELTVTPSPTVYTNYEAGTWGYPPRDYAKWGALIEAHVQHCLERYGRDEVATWLWELWNEPDINYWRGTLEEFNRLYAVTANAVRKVLPEGRVGGPTVTSGGLDFLIGFLDHTAAEDLPLDFISFHTKGAQWPTRDYKPIGEPPADLLSPSSTKMINDIREFNRVIADYPRYRDLPVYVDECDAAVPAHFGVWDNRNYRFQNTEYYPVFQVKLMKKILDLNAVEATRTERATSWSFYFEGERYFESTRSFLTAGGVQKPLLNAYRLLSELGPERIAADSDAAWQLGSLDHTDGSSMPEEVDALASRDPGGRIAILVWRHTDDQHRTDDEATRVDVTVRNLPADRYRLRHLRIDAQHSNAHTRWVELGSPQDPTDEQLALITARQGLEASEPERVLEPGGVPSTASRTGASAEGPVTLQLRLGLPAVSLLIMEPLADRRDREGHSGS